MNSSDWSLTSRERWSTPKSSRQPLAAVTPTVALSTGPLSPTESEEEPEKTSRSYNDDSKDVEIVKLRCQMEQLTQIVQTVQTRLSGSKNSTNEGDTPVVAQLKAENEELHETVAIADKRLTEFQIKMEEMEEMFMSESIKMKKDLDHLQESMEKENRHKNEISRQNERLQLAKEGLERYIKALPPQEDFVKLKRELELKNLAYQRLEEKFIIQEEKLKSLRESHSKESAQCNMLREEIVNLKQSLVEMEGVNKAHSDRLKQSRNFKEGDAEVVMEERDEAVLENKKLKRYVRFMQQKLKKTEEDLLKRLSDYQLLSEELGENLKSKSEELSVEKDTNRLLREQVSENMVKLSEKSKAIAIYEQELQSSKNCIQIKTDAKKLNLRIHRKLQSCVNDLNSLSRVSSEIVSGKSPDMSVLLGVDKRSEDPSLNTTELLGTELHLKNLETMYQALIECQEDIAKIRQVLTDRYAEVVADSVTEHCYVQ